MMNFQLRRNSRISYFGHVRNKKLGISSLYLALKVVNVQHKN